jgi:hypothetical protein
VKGRNVKGRRKEATEIHRFFYLRQKPKKLFLGLEALAEPFVQSVMFLSLRK